ncbi:Rnf electron transport complex subunit RnfB [Lysobacter ciconiae]|uniref:Rnf electron transport complex subunit RnfB n=2 Tax=Novilysobacter ciconiae TaxID=2781022 RepID=A0A7S6ZRK2_9GAMM|nr:Rnf electron transport complex subunit RnfB [Lysobacter ciconiae]
MPAPSPCWVPTAARVRGCRYGDAMQPADDAESLTGRLDRLLPQTQCGQCGYDGCLPYAEAMARGEADVDRCPPGGDAGALALALALGTRAVPFDRSRGAYNPGLVALVIEEDCIGCTKCIQACPVDAIIGGAKHMHTVLASLCTGCELCVPACPVDCIDMIGGDPPLALSVRSEG